jgi:predicted cupin superfamily sugar epimerase
MPCAAEIIAQLQLTPLPKEGGYYRETYRSPVLLPRSALPACYHSSKSAATAIFYLLTSTQFSRLHRLPTDEVYHFYLGNPVRLVQLLPDGTGKSLLLGHDLRAGQLPQVVVPAHAWQGSWLEAGPADFALLGTTMAPGFDFVDFEAGDCTRLLADYPAFAESIRRLFPDQEESRHA